MVSTYSSAIYCELPVVAGQDRLSREFFPFRTYWQLILSFLGDKYCNMMGHANGAMDYVWTLSKGAMTLYPNAGYGMHIDPGQSYWGPDFPGIIVRTFSLRSSS